MNKKKSIVLALFLIVVVAMTSCLLYACNTTVPDNTEEETVEATEGLLIPNGDFKVTGNSDGYPRTADSWTGGKMYSTSQYRDDVIAGVVSLENDLYAASKEEWDDADETIRQKLIAGGHFAENDKNKNVLMVYQPVLSKDENNNDQHGPTAYGYTSASFTLDKGSYYKLSVDVLTYDIKGRLDAESGNQLASSQPGARIYVSSNTYAEFAQINTDGAWKTYTIYIETSPASTTSLTVQLGLGKYTSSYTDGLTTGYAFFDNLSLKKIVDDPDIKNDDVANEKPEGDKTPLDAYLDALDLEKAYDAADADGKKTLPAVATTTLKVPNGRFEFGSSNVSSTTVPNSWTHVTGNSGKEDYAPTGLGYNAIIDTKQFADNFSKYAASYTTRNAEGGGDQLYYPANQLDAIKEAIDNYTGRIGNSVFMLSQQLMTAQGIRTSRSITIEKGKVYALSVSLFTYSIKGAGVSLILSGGDGKDIVIKGIQNNPSDKIYIGNYDIQPSTGYGTSDSGDGKSSNVWTTYTFYIKGNEYKDYSYNMAIWLGTDGTGSNHAVTYRNFSQNANATTYTAGGTFSSGWVFIDELQLAEIDELPAADATNQEAAENNTVDVASNEDVRGLIIDLATDNTLGGYLNNGGEDLTDVTSVGSGTPMDWTSNFDAEDKNNPRVKNFVSQGIVDIADEASFGGVGADIGAYPGMPYEMNNTNAYVIHASQDSYYEVETKPITIEANKFYRVTFWLKTVDVKSTSGAYVYVLNKTAQEKNIAENKGDDEVQLTSFTRINTADYDEYLNDWVEINIVLRGSKKEDTNIALKFTLGTGDRWATTTLTSGSMYVANFNMAELTYANYSSTSTNTYTKTCDLSSANSYTYTFTNGSFDNYDLDDDNLSGEINKLSGQSVPAKPESWTINDETMDMNKSEGTSLYAGIIQLEEDVDKSSAVSDKVENFYFKSSAQATAATGITDEDFFNKFYGDKDSPNYFDEQNMDSIAGPNVLAIGSKNTDGFAAGYSSASFTLSSNSYNMLSVYAKTYGTTKASVFLTGEASGAGENVSESNQFVIESEATSDSVWTKYVFFIKVGRNSVSLKLNLWLGEDVQYIADEDDPDYEAAVEAAKSAGHVFFDNVCSTTLTDEDKYNEEIDKAEAASGVEYKTLSFETDSFDPLSSSVDSRRSLTSPNGWSGAAGTNQSSSNTISGVIYAKDGNYYETENIDGTEYVRILGKDYTEENSDITVTDDDINTYRTENVDSTHALTDLEVRDLIVEERLTALKKNNWIPVGGIASGAKSGMHMLVINNTSKSAYTYTSSSNTFAAGSFYRVSVFVRTFGLNNINNDDDFKDLTVTDEEVAAAKAENSTAYNGMTDDEIKAELLEKKQEELRDEKQVGANIELYLGSANETGNEFSFKAIRSDEWQEYVFYVSAPYDDVTSVTVKLSLGSYSSKEIDGKTVIYGLTTGYAMFDDVSITEIEEDEFLEQQTAVEDGTASEYVKVRTVTGTESGNTDEPTTETETPKSTFNLEYLWWMIPTIVLGLVIIIVLIVYVVRKLRKNAGPKQVKIKKSPASSVTTQTLDEKHERYDSDKE